MDSSPQSVQRIKLKFLDRMNVERVAYIYFMKTPAYSKETVDAFINENESVLLGTKPTCIEEDVEFSSVDDAKANIDATTGENWSALNMALHILPPLQID